MKHEHDLTKEQAQEMWDKVKDGAPEDKDRVFETLVEDDWDVQDDVVIEPQERRMD